MSFTHHSLPEDDSVYSSREEDGEVERGRGVLEKSSLSRTQFCNAFPRASLTEPGAAARAIGEGSLQIPSGAPPPGGPSNRQAAP